MDTCGPVASEAHTAQYVFGHHQNIQRKAKVVMIRNRTTVHCVETFMNLRHWDITNLLIDALRYVLLQRGLDRLQHLPQNLRQGHTHSLDTDTVLQTPTWKMKLLTVPKVVSAVIKSARNSGGSSPMNTLSIQLEHTVVAPTSNWKRINVYCNKATGGYYRARTGPVGQWFRPEVPNL